MGIQTLSLNDKTAVISGEFSQLVQNMAAALTENGADVAILTDDIKSAQRYCQNLMDLREVSERYGRSAAIEAKLDSEASAQDAFSKAAETFGSMDIYIDAHLASLRIPWGTHTSAEELEKKFDAVFATTRMMSQAVLPFIRGRSKGRLIFLVNELDLRVLTDAETRKPTDFFSFVQNLCTETFKDQMTVNALALGITEHYLLSRFPKSRSIREAFAEVQKTIPSARMSEYPEISSVLSFLASPLSGAVNGQVLHVNHGAF